MNSVINHARIVAHCLAVWNRYSGSLTQEDKDQFDALVRHVRDDRKEFDAVLDLVRDRLFDDGVKGDAALEKAYELVAPYAEEWGVHLSPLRAIKPQ